MKTFADFYPFYLSEHANRTNHFYIEHNRPATFKHPLYSFIGDWAMWKDILTGRIKF